MKRVLLLTLGVLTVAGLASAQTPYMGIYTDNPGFADCNLEDIGFALCPVYVVQGGHTGISCSLKVDDTNSGGITNTGVIIHTPLSIGAAFTGIEFSYGQCLGQGGAVTLLMTLNYLCQGATPACSELAIVDHPQAGGILLADCTLPSPILLFAEGRKLTINGDPSCPCFNAVEQTSWGQIKALYTE